MTDDTESQRDYERKLRLEKRGIVQITQKRLDELVRKADDDTLTAIYMVGYHKRDDEVRKLTEERDVARFEADAYLAVVEQLEKERNGTGGGGQSAMEKN